MPPGRLFPKIEKVCNAVFFTTGLTLHLGQKNLQAGLVVKGLEHLPQSRSRGLKCGSA